MASGGAWIRQQSAVLQQTLAEVRRHLGALHQQVVHLRVDVVDLPAQIG